ncbi:MAG TPA: zinc-dependent alcohol dehydrogenase family protein [Pyrinomonadaceae bacterium]|nr:zinc-dependent alcohol dehydrogenase family protein [Pyrinomonadaceae bacterium]
MKAWLLNKVAPVAERPLTFSEVPMPVPGDNEVLLRIDACGICRTDLHVIEGDLPVRRSPLIPGHQIVGRVTARGKRVKDFAVGDRVGVAWLNHTCGACEFCCSRRENLCEQPQFTGWTVDGGYAEYAVAPASFTYHIPEDFEAAQAAPLLCAGIIGYRCLRLTGITESEWRGARVGLYGFGAAGHISIQLARARGGEVYVCTRDRERHQALAHELGATWVGDARDEPPVKLDASIIFAPAGELVPVALKAIRKGGTVVLGGIHMSTIPAFDYSLIYGERVVRSVANNTRVDGREFLAEAARIPVRTHVETFNFDQANEALIALQNDAIRGAAVLVIG